MQIMQDQRYVRSNDELGKKSQDIYLYSRRPLYTERAAIKHEILMFLDGNASCNVYRHAESVAILQRDYLLKKCTATKKCSRHQAIMS